MLDTRPLIGCRSCRQSVGMHQRWKRSGLGTLEAQVPYSSGRNLACAYYFVFFPRNRSLQVTGLRTKRTKDVSRRRRYEKIILCVGTSVAMIGGTRAPAVSGLSGSDRAGPLIEHEQNHSSKPLKYPQYTLCEQSSRWRGPNPQSCARMILYRSISPGSHRCRVWNCSRPNAKLFLLPQR